MLLVGNHAAAKVALGALAAECQVGLVACHPVVQRDDVVVHPAVGLLLYVEVAHPCVLGVGFLQAVKVEPGVVSHVCLDDLCGEELAVVDGVVAEQQLYLGFRFHYDEHAAVGHQVDVGAQYVYHLHRSVNLCALGHIHKQSVLRHHCVEGGYCIAVGLGDARVVFPDEMGLFGGFFGQRANDYAFGQVPFGLQFGIESVVDHEVKRCAQVGHVAPEGLVRVDGNLQPVKVEAVVGGEERRHVGVLVPLHLPCGQPLPAEVVVGGVPRGIHHVAAVAVYHVAALRVDVHVLPCCVAACCLWFVVASHVSPPLLPL